MHPETFGPILLPELPKVLHAHLQGDNNWGDDRSLYPKGQLWLNRDHLMGRVTG